MHRRSIKQVLLVTLIPISLLFYGCNKNALKAAETFSLTSASFQDATTKLSNDIYDSCIRKTKFFPIDTVDAQKTQTEAITICEVSYRPTAQRTQIASQVITDYMIAIGQLASENTVNFNKRLEDIRDSLNKLNSSGNLTTLSQSDVQVGIDIVGLLINWGKQTYQQDNLKKAIICTDEPFQQYSKSLINVFQDGYLNGILKLEQERVTEYYYDYATLLEKQNGSLKDRMEIEQKYGSAIDSIATKRDAALAYIGIIERTAAAHGQLKAIFSKGKAGISSQEEKAKCQEYFTIKSQGNSLSQSPESFQLSSKEKERVAEVVLQYSQEVKPLLQKVNKSF